MKYETASTAKAREREDVAAAKAVALAARALDVELAREHDDERVLPQRLPAVELGAGLHVDDPALEGGHVGGAIAKRSTSSGCRKTSISAIRPSARRRTEMPIGRGDAASASRMKSANAGCLLARVGTRMCWGAPGASGFEARNARIASRPWYQAGVGGIATRASSASSAASASTSVRSQAAM